MKVEDLIYELIGENNDSSLVKQYNQKEEKFSFEFIYNSNDDKLLTEKYRESKKLLDDFQQNYKKLFAIAVNIDKSLENREKAKTYSEIGILYVNAIQNLYLNPINYRINELKTKESLKKADKSICIGKLSIAIALLIAIITFGLELCDSKKRTDNQTIILQQQVDSLKVVNVENDKQILELKIENDSIKNDLLNNKKQQSSK